MICFCFPPGLTVHDALYELVEQEEYPAIKANHFRGIVKYLADSVPTFAGEYPDVIAMGYDHDVDGLVVQYYPGVITVDEFNDDCPCHGGAVYRRLL